MSKKAARGWWVLKELYCDPDLYSEPEWAILFLEGLVLFAEPDGTIRDDARWLHRRILAGRRRRSFRAINELIDRFEERGLLRRIRVAEDDLFGVEDDAGCTRDAPESDARRTQEAPGMHPRVTREGRKKDTRDVVNLLDVTPFFLWNALRGPPCTLSSSGSSRNTPRAREGPGGEEEDQKREREEAWDDFARQAGEQEHIDDGVAYARGVRTRGRYDHPREAGKTWYVERPTRRSEERRRRKLLEQVKAHEGEVVRDKVRGELRIERLGVSGPKGLVPWDRLSAWSLECLRGQLVASRVKVAHIRTRVEEVLEKSRRSS